jgi:lysozyme family protein
MFDKAVQIILRLEGGYVNHPNDPGGETKYGISKRAYPDLNIAALTKEQAIAIYKRDYWDKAECDLLEPAFALAYFDMAVNSGVSAARRLLGTCPTYEQFIAGRIAFYTALPTFKHFGLGWMRRLEHVMTEGFKLRQKTELNVLVIESAGEMNVKRQSFFASVDNKPISGRKLHVRFK